MIYTKKQILKTSTEDLKEYAQTLHYVLYEREFPKGKIMCDEKFILDEILNELKTRGIKLGWTGITGATKNL